MRNVLALATLLTATIIELVTTTPFENPRVLGGTPAKPGQFPWIVSIHEKKGDKLRHFCGGAIVEPSHILTAGHCVWNKEPKDLTVVAGAYNISDVENHQQRMAVKDIIVHPDYVSGDEGGAYDSAILRLVEPLTFAANIGNVSLADPQETASGVCKSAGWGNLFPFSQAHYHGSDVLITAPATVIDLPTCLVAYPAQLKHLTTAICTRSSLLSGTCQGDSGGPLICFRSGEKPYLAGVVSWGFALCGDAVHPDVYTDISHASIHSFITQYIDHNHTHSRMRVVNNVAEMEDNVERDVERELHLPKTSSNGVIQSVMGGFL